MAKRCEICGKGPGRRPEHQPRAQRDRPPVRAEPPAGPRDGQRRHPPPARLHPLPPVEQGRQGRLRRSPQCRRGGLHASAPAGDRAVLPGHPGRGPAVSSPVRFRSIRRPATWSTGTSPRRPTASSRTSAPSSRPPARRSIDVVRTTVYLADMNDFAAMNEVYGDLLLVARARRAPPSRPRACRRTRGSRST